MTNRDKKDSIRGRMADAGEPFNDARRKVEAAAACHISKAELLEIDGRKLRFKVEAHDEDKQVGKGTHRRAIVAVQRHG